MGSVRVRWQADEYLWVAGPGLRLAWHGMAAYILGSTHHHVASLIREPETNVM